MSDNDQVCPDLTNCPTWEKFKTNSKTFWIKNYCQGPKQDVCARKQQKTQRAFIPDELLPNGEYLTPSGTDIDECQYLKKCPVWNNFQTDIKMIWIKAYCQGPKRNKCARKQRSEVGESVAENLLPNGQNL